LALEYPSDDEAPSAPTTVAYAPDASSEDLEAAGAIASETERTYWDHDAWGRIRTLLGGRRRLEIQRVLELADIDTASARLLARFLALRAVSFEERVGKRLLMRPVFVRIGAAPWELTAESRANFALPFHPKLVAPLTPPPSLGFARGQYERCEAIGRFRFASGQSVPALRCVLRFRSHQLHITTSADLLRDDWSMADHVDQALSLIAAEHLRLVEEIVLDPGDHPSGNVAANTSWDGTRINMFLFGAGKAVKQEELDDITVHEVGHVVSLQQSDWLWFRWDAAMADDKLGVSTYGMTNRVEDFAESYQLFVSGGRTDATTRAKYPARFAILDSLFVH
jgi:hypothetical protein